MKIAIIGAGFSGIAAAWFCLEEGHEVTLFDAKGIGAGASGIAAGLLHPFVGVKASLNWNGLEAFAESKALLDIASNARGSCVYRKTGMFRPAISENQKADFKKTAHLHPDIASWQMPSSELDVSQEGLFVNTACTVDCAAYLDGLWKACKARGAYFEKAAIEHIDALAGFDCSIFAPGASKISVTGVSFPSIQRIKGQLLELDLDTENLPFAINSSAYIVQFQPFRCIAGATFERSWHSEEPDIGACEAYIRSSIGSFSPKLSSLPFRECRAGFRAMSKNKLPIIEKLAPAAWYIGAMGARGLLYHAFFAKRLVSSLS